METLWLCKDFWLLSWFTRCRLILRCSYALNVHVNRLEEAVRPLEKKTNQSYSETMVTPELNS